MIRFILVCITVIGYLVLMIPVLLIEWIIGKFAPMKKDISSLRMVQAIFKFILWLTGARVTVIGEENVPKDQAVLYVANHRSYFDILLTYSRCPGRTGYVAKKKWSVTRCSPTGCTISTVSSLTEKISNRDLRPSSRLPTM